MKPTLLFHVQHFLGMGHLVRAFALAEALAQHLHVVIASGGKFPAGIDIPDGVEIVQLPALGFDGARCLISHEPGIAVSSVLEQRRRILLDLEERLRPDAVLVELFPFGRKKLGVELVALLEQARSRLVPPLIVTSVRDLLVTGRHDQQRHDDRAAATLNAYFDLVLVHGDAEFARLDLSFQPAIGIDVAIHYTGFVGPADAGMTAPATVRPGTVVVSAGGGWVGGPLMHSCIDAAPMIHRRHGVTMTLITGPLVGDDVWTDLKHRVADSGSVELVRSVPGLLPTLREAAVSISQAGYNTTVDLLRANVPAVLVPYGDERENEQPRRAELLESAGLAVRVDPVDLSAKSIADAVSAVMHKSQPEHGFALDGAEFAAALLCSQLSTSVGAAP